MSIRTRSLLLGISLGCIALAACTSDASSDDPNPGGGSGSGQLAGAGAPNSAAGSAPTAGSGSPSAGTAGSAGVAGAAGAAGAAGVAGATGVSAGGSVATGGSAGAPATTVCTGNATYHVTLDVTWSDPNVADKHYTTLIGGVHSAGVSFWKLGGLATAGIRAMAEAGGTAPLSDEVQSAINAGTARSVIKLGGGKAPGTSNGTFDVSAAFPLVSFGSMLAPTPDWFVGVSSLSLCEAGAWVSEKTLDAVVYDAGTKDGADFDYGFPETKPHAPIGYAVKFPNELPVGKLTFQKR